MRKYLHNICTTQVSFTSCIYIYNTILSHFGEAVILVIAQVLGQVLGFKGGFLEVFWSYNGTQNMPETKIR